MIFTLLFFLLYPISAVITAVLAIYGYKNRNILISHPFILLMVATTVWTMGDGLITQTTDPVLAYIINTAMYPAIVTVPVAWFFFILIYTGRDQNLTGKRILLLFIIPAINVILVATNPWHFLFYPDIIPEIVTGGVFWHFSHGILFPITIFYSYLLVFIALVFITSRLFGPTDLYRKQTSLLFISCFIPFILNIIYVTNPEIHPPIDLTPFSFTLVGLLIALGIIRYQLFTSVPVAYVSLFSSMHDGVFATDRKYRIIDLNPAAIRICGWSSSRAIGKTINTVIPAVSTMIGVIDDPDEKRQEIILGLNGEAHNYEVSDFPLIARKGIIGRIYTLRDISQRISMEKDLRESQEKLQLAIDGSHIGIWEYDIRTQRMDIGNKWLEILGFEQDKNQIPCSREEIIDPEDMNRIRELLLEHLSGEDHFFESDIRMKCRDGSSKWMYIRGKSTEFDETGNPVMMIGTSLDISERRNAQEALEMANKKLNLLSGITRHDILNQVTALRYYIEFSLDETPEGTVHEYLNKSESITRMIQNQIEFTRLYENVGIHAPVWQTVADIVEKVKENIFSGSLFYHVDVTGVLLFADPLLEKVFFTLIENTLRHGKKATDIWFSYQIYENDLILIYEDNGVGVNLSDKNKIFVRGYGKNTGFGLFISREILAITGMAIKETGEPGKGVQFEIRVHKGSWRVIVSS